MSYTINLGIDPGQSGGIACISHGKAYAHKMPETNRDILDLLKSMTSDCRDSDGSDFDTHAVAVIESVHAMPKQGVTSSFNFGKNFGGLLMALEACDISYELVTPQKWQKFMGCLTRGDKNVSKAAAQRLFPTIKMTHAIADSLLLAEYGKRMNF